MTGTSRITSPDGKWSWDGVTWQPVIATPDPASEDQSSVSPSPVASDHGPVLPPAASLNTVSSGRSGSRSPTSRRRREIVAGVGLTALLAVGLVCATTLGHGSPTPTASNKAVTILPTGDQGDTPNQKCSTDVYDAAADMVNNGQDGGVRELQVGGANNPVYSLAIRVEQQYEVDLNSVGRQQATTNANALASQLCAGQGNPNQDAFGGPPYVPGQDSGSTSTGNGDGDQTTEVTVPDVTGQGFCDAQQTLQSAGLSSSSNSAGQCSDTVTSEDPSGGSTVPQGAAITLGVG